MLLKHLYDFSISRRLLEDTAFTNKTVRWIIDLDSEGNLLGDGFIQIGDAKRGKEFSCPQTNRPKVAGGVSEFLADGITALFGYDTDPDAIMPEKKRLDRDRNNQRKRQDFWDQIQQAKALLEDPALSALLHYKSNLENNTTQLLRWGKDSQKPSEKNYWWIRTASGGETKLGNDNFSFRVNGELLLEKASLRQYWFQRHQAEVRVANDGYSKGLCLVSGKPDQPIAPTHNPKIQGVPNTQSFGAAIVSFDKDAFASYGFDQSLNAPTSDEAATAYGTALNWMLKHDDHSIRIGQTSLCFWARENKGSNAVFASLLNRPDPKSVRSFVVSPWSGIERELAMKDEFFTITLAGNSGRIVVKHWLQQPLDVALKNLQKWFVDLQIYHLDTRKESSSDEDRYSPLSIYWLSRCTVSDEAAKKLEKNLPAETSTQLYRAALEGTAPSIALLKPILHQLHSKLVRDEHYNPLYDLSRFALLKLILNRNRNEQIMEIKEELTAETRDPAYNCGRLLALLNETQKKAHEYQLKGATIVEKYFGTASTSPGYVLPYLLKLNRHHLGKIAKSEKYAGDERFMESTITTILALFQQTEPMKQQGLAPAFPRTLDLQAQGRFTLGFYQQMAADAKARASANAQQESNKE